MTSSSGLTATDRTAHIELELPRAQIFELIFAVECWKTEIWRMVGSTPEDRAKVTVKDPPSRPLPGVETEVLTSVETDTLEDSHVYVHCHFDAPWEHALIRIWKTTYLIDQASASRSELVHAENISIAPQWTMIPDRTKFSFLLIFSALPKSCVQFDLKEEITQPGGFHVKNIQRNETDVYHVNIG